MSTEKFFINQNQAELDADKSRARQKDLMLNNLKYQLIGKLRSEGAIKISIDAIEIKNKEIEIKAKYILGGYKEGVFRSVLNHMGNNVIKNFELSLENATPVQNVVASSEPLEEQKMIFDLALIQAKEAGRDQYELIYPTVGVIGILAKSNIDSDTIKKLCSLSANHFGIKPEFTNELKVAYVVDDTLPEISSEDKMFELQKDIKAFTSHNTEEKERAQTITLRENFIQSIELKAQDAIKKLGFSYSKGSPKILSTDSVLEFVDNKFDGHVVVKAKVGDEIISYALPVVKNHLVIKAKLEVYKTNTEQFKDELAKRVNEDIRATLKQDIEVIQANFSKEQEDLLAPGIITAAKVSDLQKVIKTTKEWLPVGIEAGYELNLHGNMYKVEFEENGVNVNLVLVNG